MAPVYMACRLPALFVFVLLLLLITCSTQHVSSMFIYDRTQLLKIQATVEAAFKNDFKGSGFIPPHLLENVPVYLCRSSPGVHRRRRGRKRGKRGGIIVKLKQARGGRDLGAEIRLCAGLAVTGGHNRRIDRRFTKDRCGWIQQILPKGPAVRRTGWSRVCTRGIDLQNLRSIHCERQLIKVDTSFHMALLNVRSVGNKTFMVNDFIRNNKLDFLFLSETWLKVGDLTPMTELLPQGYAYFNSPRLTGRGGGLMSIFKDDVGCRSISFEFYNSFELQTFQIMQPTPVLVALVYRPPKLNKDFINIDI